MKLFSHPMSQDHHQLNAESLTLDEVLSSVWQMLVSAANDRKSPIHTGILATAAEQIPQLRTVVLRRVISQSRTLICHTDVRSQKFSEIEKNANVAWMFYDTLSRIQFRLSGFAVLHTGDAVADEHWSKTTLQSRRIYLSLAPALPLNEASSGLPEAVRGQNPSELQSELGRENFAVIATTVEKIDWLWLNATGHLRAQFHWQDNHLSAKWVAP
jgi:pyridoxamine 5'-phosphate oxidase